MKILYRYDLYVTDNFQLEFVEIPIQCKSVEIDNNGLGYFITHNYKEQFKQGIVFNQTGHPHAINLCHNFNSPINMNNNFLFILTVSAYSVTNNITIVTDIKKDMKKYLREELKKYRENLMKINKMLNSLK